MKDFTQPSRRFCKKRADLYGGNPPCPEEGKRYETQIKTLDRRIVQHQDADPDHRSHLGLPVIGEHILPWPDSTCRACPETSRAISDWVCPASCAWLNRFPFSPMSSPLPKRPPETAARRAGNRSAVFRTSLKKSGRVRDLVIQVFSW